MFLVVCDHLVDCLSDTSGFYDGLVTFGSAIPKHKAGEWSLENNMNSWARESGLGSSHLYILMKTSFVSICPAHSCCFSADTLLKSSKSKQNKSTGCSAPTAHVLS